MKYAAAFLILLSLFAGCKKEGSPTETAGSKVTDAQLYQLVLNTPKAAFYNNSTDTIPGSSGAAHPGNILVWYNAKAKEQLGTGGKVNSSATFADSSLVVKEMFNATTKVRTAIAIFFKSNSASNAGPGGWIWSELNGDGTVIPTASAKEKGAICIGCHTAGNFDHTLMNVTHP